MAVVAVAVAAVVVAAVAAVAADIAEATIRTITDAEAVASFQLCTRIEGIVPALESAHASAYAVKIAGGLAADHLMVINLSGRGDKDLDSVERYLEAQN